MAKISSKKTANITVPSAQAKVISVDRDMLFEQYKIFVESADKISERRLTANSFFLTVNTAIFGVSGFSDIGTTYINLAGVILCAVWYGLINSYKRLNAAKFKVIHDIEKSLPRALYREEWETLQNDDGRKAYKHFSDMERYVPFVFGAIHSYLLIPPVVIFFLGAWSAISNIFMH